jgi:hypothetical protein
MPADLRTGRSGMVTHVFLSGRSHVVSGAHHFRVSSGTPELPRKVPWTR